MNKTPNAETTKSIITVKTTIKAPIKLIWETLTKPSHIMKWNHASPDWECPHAENDVRVGGKFVYRMSAKDKSMSFDFSGKFVKVEMGKELSYVIDDGRAVSIILEEKGNSVDVIETFEAENSNPKAMQQNGWQAILNSFKKHVESL